MNIKAALGANGRDKRFSGFTIVELLVSLGLVIFIMSLVSTIFVIATKSFRDMKAAGDLSEQLRSAGQLIRGMVKATHFTDNVQPSDEKFWQAWDSSGAGSYYSKSGTPPLYTDAQFKDPSNTFGRKGYLRLDQLAQPVDPFMGGSLDFDSIRVLTGNALSDQRLSMTVLQNGSTPSDLFSAYYPDGLPNPGFPGTRLPGTNCPAFLTNIEHKYFESAQLVRRPNAEVAFFLAPPDLFDAPKTGLISGDATNLPLYSLHMKTWLLKESTDSGGGPAPQLSIPPPPPIGLGGTAWNDLASVGVLFNRAPMELIQTKLESRFNTNTLILRNVLSFEVQMLDNVGNPIFLGVNGFFDTSAEPNWTKFTPMMGPATYSNKAGSWVANQWQNQPAGNGASLTPLKIFALKIILRVYDPDNEITRQMTIIEPL